MIEVYPNLFVGKHADETGLQTPEGYKDGWYIISAAKSPWHKEALGYTERAAPKDHPEYLMAYRPQHLILNLIDPPDVEYIPAAIMDAADKAIVDNIEASKVLVHCNLGISRSPTIAMLYLAAHTGLFDGMTHEEAVTTFAGLYPPYDPGNGVAEYARLNWPVKIAA